MKKIRATACLLLAFAMFFLPSCLSGAEDSAAPSGVREGVYYLFLQEEALLILKSGGTKLSFDSRVFSMDFAPEVRCVYLAQGTEEWEKNAFEGLENLETIYIYKTCDTSDFETSARVVSGVKDFESGVYLPSGKVLGHCPEQTLGKCLLCGKDCVYQYPDMYVNLLIDGTKVCDSSLVTEGETRHFDGEGKLLCEGFSTVGGYTRYFKENRMVTGSADIDGTRCSFSSSGALVSQRTLDRTFSPLLFLPAVGALALGMGIVWGVYRFYKRKSGVSGAEI